MAEINDFHSLDKLELDVLAEVVREGEQRVQAQLAAAIAADQRALTFAGFQIAAATAALAGGVALMIGDHADLILAVLALLFAGGILVAARDAIGSARPEEFCFPGNSPSAWLPNRWIGKGDNFSLKQARIEQAYCLAEQIQDNKEAAAQSARRMHRSMDRTLWFVAIAGVILLAVLLGRTLVIREPTSEIFLRQPHSPASNTPLVAKPERRP